MAGGEDGGVGGEGSPPAAPAVLASKEHGSGHADPQDRKAHGPPFGSPCCQARLGSDKPFRSPFGSPGWMGEMAPAGWMGAHPYPLPHFFAPSSLHLSHTIITCQASTVTSSRTAAAWSSTTKSRRSSSRNTSPATDKHAQPSAFILPPSLFPSILPTSLSP